MRTVRRRIPILPVVLVMVTLLAPVYPERVNAQSDPDIIEIRINDVVKFIQQDEGRVVMLALYASWCPSCQRFFPELLRLAGGYMSREVDVLALLLDDTKEEAGGSLQPHSSSPPASSSRRVDRSYVSTLRPSIGGRSRPVHPAPRRPREGTGRKGFLRRGRIKEERLIQRKGGSPWRT